MTERSARRIVSRGEAHIQTDVRQSGEIVNEQVRTETFPIQVDNGSGKRMYPAMVEVDGSSTINLGNYNSARVGVRVSIPVGMPLLTVDGYTDQELAALDRAYLIARDKVDEYLEQEMAAINQS